VTATHGSAFWPVGVRDTCPAGNCRSTTGLRARVLAADLRAGHVGSLCASARPLHA